MNLPNSAHQRPLSTRLDALMADLNQHARVWTLVAQGQDAVKQRLETLLERLNQAAPASAQTGPGPDLSSLRQEIASLRSLLQQTPLPQTGGFPPDLLQNIQSLGQDCRSLKDLIQEQAEGIQVLPNLTPTLRAHAQAMSGLAQGQESLSADLKLLLKQFDDLQQLPEVVQPLSQLRAQMQDVASQLQALPQLESQAEQIDLQASLASLRTSLEERLDRADPEALQSSLTSLKLGLEERLKNIERQIRATARPSWASAESRNSWLMPLLLVVLLGGLWLWMNLTLAPLLTRINNRLNTVELRLNKLNNPSTR